MEAVYIGLRTTPVLAIQNLNNVFEELQSSEIYYNQFSNYDIKSFPLVFDDYIIP